MDTRWGSSSSPLGGDGNDGGQIVKQLGASAAVVLLVVSVFGGAAAAVSVGTPGHVSGAVEVSDVAEEDGPERPPEEPCRPIYLERFSNGISEFDAEEHEECPEEPPVEEEPSNPNDDGDSNPPDVLSFVASYDNSSSEVTVTVEFDEELGSGHVLLFDENGDRIGDGRLTENVLASGHTFDTSFDVPADEAMNYTAELKDAADQHNNEIENPGQYTDTAAVELASETTATPEPTATPTPIPTATPTPVPTATPTAIPTATPVRTTIQEGVGADGGAGDGDSSLDAGGPTTTTTEPAATGSNDAATDTPNAAADVSTTTQASAADEPSPTDSSSGSNQPTTAVLGALLLLVALGGLTAYRMRD